ncbi:MAG: hypothetical protein WBA97_00190 [Actinophytocola sp.]|uniref:hypothetical protein n=1 Tax=Actinophytocola sp. TaxID=1872138 RepID=UPI003C7176D9
MAQAQNDVSQTAAFARRVVRRTLTVVGGMAAGTAIAWCLSSASAAADEHQPLLPIEHQVQLAIAGVQDFAEPVTGHVAPPAGTVETVAEYLQNPPPPPTDPLKDLGEKVKHAAVTLRIDAQDGLEVLPACDECLAGDTHHEYPPDGFGRSDLPAAPVLAPVAGAASATVPGVDLDAIASRTAKDRAIADGMSRRGSPEPAQPSLPNLPGVPTPMPFAPAGVPATGGHGSAANSVDSQLFAALPWQDSTFDLTRGGIASACDAATSGRPGVQPGVAPD